MVEQKLPKLTTGVRFPSSAPKALFKQRRFGDKMTKRLHFIDHLRAAMFVLMILDHALHAYALNWGRFWFFQDYDRSIIFDAFYMHNQNIIMPMLFFIFGMFVLPSAGRRGIGGYLKERAIRLGIPYVICIPLLVPLLTYPRYEETEMPGAGFLDYWFNVFFTEKLQGGPLWVLHAMMLYSVILLLVAKVIPNYSHCAKAFAEKLVQYPIKSFIGVGIVGAMILGVSDLIWGAPWWIGFWKIFYLQGSRFLFVLLCFFLGSAVSAAGLFEDQSLLDRLAKYWQQLLGLSITLGVIYAVYSLYFYHDGAFSGEIRYYFHSGGTWQNAWSVIAAESPMVLVRTTLSSFLCLSQMLALLAVFMRFFRNPTPIWTSLAKNVYGIFLIHETLVVWGQYYLIGTDLPIAVKFVLTATFGLFGAWLLNDRVMLRIPAFKRVLSPG